MTEEIIIAGFGGQGILSLGMILAQTGMMENLYVTWLPSYGPEMRGGTAYCSTVISKNEIGSPLASNPNVLFVFNRQSLEKFEKDVVEGGLIVYNTSIVDKAPTRTDVNVLAIPASEIADELGSVKYANSVVIGAFIEFTKSFEKESVFSALPYQIKKNELIPVNEKAILKGIEYVQKNIL